jgi:hypothetical protein
MTSISSSSGGFVAQSAEDVLALTLEDLKKIRYRKPLTKFHIHGQSLRSPFARGFIGIDYSRIPDERRQECLNHIRYHLHQSRIRLFERLDVLIWYCLVCLMNRFR